MLILSVSNCCTEGVSSGPFGSGERATSMVTDPAGNPWGGVEALPGAPVPYCQVSSKGSAQACPREGTGLV
jgi:hypothetical protein